MKEIFDYMFEHSGGNSIDFNSMISDINRLEAENARFRDALEDIVHCIYSNEATLNYCEKKAREALKGE